MAQVTFKPTYIDLNFNVGINVFSELLYDVDAIRNSLYNLFTTPIGSRAFVPEYGSRFLSLLQAPEDSATINILRMSIYQEVATWEPRVSLNMNGILVQPIFGGFQMYLNYTIKQSGLASNFQLAASN